eukprot:284086-Pyramimonas_sp.AAC.1
MATDQGHACTAARINLGGYCSMCISRASSRIHESVTGIVRDRYWARARRPENKATTIPKPLGATPGQG